MDRGSERRQSLRCKPGDLARIKYAWNQALVGRIVLVEAAHSTTEWRVTLLGAAGVTLTKNRRRLTAGNRMLAYDAALEPIQMSEGPLASQACRCGS
ncbi:hypothetical protein EFP18_23450 [Burkholderia glumae]|nr:hypothetical protein Y5A_000265 [Burkholderia glumae AU6208]UVS87039.1 hypothetical protein EFP18_23450 [Burkholderia glumae]